MGGDFAPVETVKGAVWAASDNIEITLVGSENIIRKELSNYNITNLPIHIVNASEVIHYNEPPVEALRQKPDSSIAVSIRLVKEAAADAMVSMGPTGAIMACAKEVLGMLPGIRRPVMGGKLMGYAPHTVVFDMGANVDCRPQQLLGFGVFGCAAIRAMYDIANPTVAILSNGGEATRGNRLVKETYVLLQNSGMNFIGSIEANEIPSGKANVIVCDGFTGNALIKLSEGLGQAIVRYLETRLRGQVPDSEIQSIGAEIITATNVADYQGGGMLYGVDGVIVKGHGRYKARELNNAIHYASTLVQKHLVKAIKSELAKYESKMNDNMPTPQTDE